MEEEILLPPKPGLPVDEIPEEPSMEFVEEVPEDLPDTLEVPLDEAEPDLIEEPLPEELPEILPEDAPELPIVTAPEAPSDAPPVDTPEPDVPEDLPEEEETDPAPEPEMPEEEQPVPEQDLPPAPELVETAEPVVPEVDLPDVNQPEPEPADDIVTLPEPPGAPPETTAATSAPPLAFAPQTGRPPSPRIPGIELSLPPAPSGGGGGALAALMCHKMTEEQRRQAKCDLQATQQVYKDLANAGLDREEQNRLDDAYAGKLRQTLPADTAIESFLKKNSEQQKYMLDGIDNTIFLDRRSESEMQHDRLMRGDTMDWEKDIRDAHEDDEE
ncbi:MAG: hypothetical protein CMF04_10015 [Hyphomonas sp.]|nr:hypothetical protein [Hyphomonas sp.]